MWLDPTTWGTIIRILDWLGVAIAVAATLLRHVLGA